MIRIEEVDTYIENAPKPQRLILEELRQLIEQSIPHSVEKFKWSRPVYATEKGFCYLQSTKKHVTLGFYNFEKVDDPNDLLEGTGKQMRHIKISRLEDIKSSVFTKMLQEAAKID